MFPPALPSSLAIFMLLLGVLLAMAWDAETLED